jgi:hypothetical protein
MKDFVEIYPVTETAQGFTPIYDDSNRAPSEMFVDGPGSFDLTPNPDYVEGAYQNIRHYQARSEIEARGLIFEEGQTHRLPIDDALLALRTNSFTLIDGNIKTSSLVDGFIGQAARAGAAGGATHVEIKIS